MNRQDQTLALNELKSLRLNKSFLFPRRLRRDLGNSAKRIGKQLGRSYLFQAISEDQCKCTCIFEGAES